MKAQLSIVAAAVLVTAWQMPTAWAISNQHLNPHSDAAGDISWQQSAGDPNTINHFHLPLRGGETITVGATSMTGLGWAADSVWDDRFYRFQDTAPATGNNALINNFAHGYIDPVFAPRFYFQDHNTAGASDIPAAAQADLAQTFADWNTAAKAQSAGKTTAAGHTLSTSIAAGSTASAASAEFTFRFSTTLQGENGAFAQWCPSTSDVNGSSVTAAMQMVYATTPTEAIFFSNADAPANWKMRKHGSADPWTRAITESVGWNFDPNTATGSTINDTVDYSPDNGTTVYASGLGGVAGAPSTLHDSVFGTEDTSSILNFFPLDFYTIALHETGHVLGLLHTPGNTAGAIMRSEIAFNAGNGNTLHTIDTSSAYGAALLYSIPVPEPTSLGLLAMGGLFLARRRR